MSGIVALSDMLKTNSSLRELECVLLAPWVHVHVLALRRLLSAAVDTSNRLSLFQALWQRHWSRGCEAPRVRAQAERHPRHTQVRAPTTNNCLHYRQQPLTCAIDPLLFRLQGNQIGAEGARHLALALEANSTLRVLGYVTKSLMTDAIIVSSQ